MNKVILMGRLTQDPEVRYTQSATPMAVAKYGLAVKRQFAKQGEVDTDFFNITAFGKSGEFAEKYFSKGQMVAVTGKLQNNNWEDQNKIKHYGVNVIAEEQHFAESKNAREQREYQERSNGFSGQPNNGYQSPSYNPPSNNPSSGFQVMEEDDDLPF